MLDQERNSAPTDPPASNLYTSEILPPKPVLKGRATPPAAADGRSRTGASAHTRPSSKRSEDDDDDRHHKHLHLYLHQLVSTPDPPASPLRSESFPPRDLASRMKNIGEQPRPPTMAAPPEKTLRNLNGAWVMNKALSGNSDAVMQLQGIGWIIRKTVSFATVTLHVKQYADAATHAVHIDIDQSLSPGNIKGTSEKRTLNWDLSAHVDHVFGSLRGRSRWTTLPRVGDDYAVGPDAAPGGADAVAKERQLDVLFMRDGQWDASVTQRGDEVVESWVESDEGGWMAWQIWGFELVDGVRRHVRHVVVRGKGGKGVKRLRLVYDWVDGSDDGGGAGAA